MLKNSFYLELSFTNDCLAPNKYVQIIILIFQIICRMELAFCTVFSIVDSTHKHRHEDSDH